MAEIRVFTSGQEPLKLIQDLAQAVSAIDTFNADKRAAETKEREQRLKAATEGLKDIKALSKKVDEAKAEAAEIKNKTAPKRVAEPESESEDEKPAPKKRVRRTKAQIEADKKAAAKKAAADDDDDEDPEFFLPGEPVDDDDDVDPEDNFDFEDEDDEDDDDGDYVQNDDDDDDDDVLDVSKKDHMAKLAELAAEVCQSRTGKKKANDLLTKKYKTTNFKSLTDKQKVALYNDLKKLR